MGLLHWGFLNARGALFAEVPHRRCNRVPPYASSSITGSNPTRDFFNRVTLPDSEAAGTPTNNNAAAHKGAIR